MSRSLRCSTSPAKASTGSRSRSRPTAVFQPDELRGAELAAFPFLASRFEHLRLTEYRDTAVPGREDPAEAGRLAAWDFHRCWSFRCTCTSKPAGVLAVGRTMARGPWDVNVQLLLKLIGTSLASGIERLAMSTQLANLTARYSLIEVASNEGMWDFNFDTNQLFVSDRWKAMMGYPHLGPDDIVDWRGMVHPDDLSRVQEAMFKHVSGARRFSRACIACVTAAANIAG